ncbi:MAG TPA: RHS repeat-associated core domain-containing protein [Candidatus Angelobacter sp.]|nr:RHS repeat-associated core domain-containing protein [Candidatus Angelobacter sp.]
MRLSGFWRFGAVTLLAAIPAFTQTVPVEPGFKPYGSFHGSDIDLVNLHDGGLNLRIPLISWPQRGGLHLGFFIGFNDASLAFIKDTRSAPCDRGCGKDFAAGVADGVMVFPDFLPSVQFSGPFQTSAGELLGQPAGIFDGMGTLHSFFNLFNAESGANNPPPPSNTPIAALDGSGYTMTLLPGSCPSISNYISAMVQDRRGVRYTYPTSCLNPLNVNIEDPNGNQITVSNVALGDLFNVVIPNDPAPGTSTITDSMGRSIVAPPGPDRGVAVGFTPSGTAAPIAPATFATPGPAASTNGCTGSPAAISAQLWTVPGPSGGTVTFKFCFTQIYINISAFTECTFHPTGDANQNCYVNYGPYNRLSSVVLPDGTAWGFIYDSAPANSNSAPGAPLQIGDLSGITLPTGGTINYTWGGWQGTDATHRKGGVITRTVNANDGAGPQQWTYQGVGSQTQNASGGLNPTQVVATVTDPLGNITVHTSTDLSGALNLYETLTQYEDPSGNVLKTVQTAYSGAITTASGISPGGVMNVFPTSITTTLANGLVSTVQKDYDFNPPGNQGGVSFGTVLAEREFDYGNGSPGPKLRETDTTYQWQSSGGYLSANLLDLPASAVVKDGSGNRVAETDYTYDESSYLTAYTGTLPQGTHVAAPNGSVRGNLTTVSKWLNTSSNPVVSHTNWYDTGEVYQQIDPLGNTTTHSYDPAYAGAYSTKTCNALSECVSGAYDFNTGLLTSLTDANGNTSSYSYDLMSRMTLAQLPADPSGNRPQTTFTYSPANSFPVTVQRQKTITSSLTDSVTTYLDGLGRPYETQHATPNGNATVVTTYDAAGRVASTTNPYFTTSDPTYGVTQSQYDGLGRVTQTIKQDGSVTAAAYEQTAGVSTNADCTITADEADKQRKTCTDGLGRLIEVNEPQASSVGTSATASVTISGTLNSAPSTDLLPAAGTSLTSYVAADGTPRVVYLGANQHVYQLAWSSGGGWQGQDLTALTGTPLAGSSSGLAAIVNAGGCPHLEYVDMNQHVNDLYLPNTSGGCLTNWANEDLTALSGNTLASAASPLAISGAGGDSLMNIYYVDSNRHANRLYWPRSGGFQNQDLTAAAAGPTVGSGSGLAAIVNAGGCPHLEYVDMNQHVNDLYLPNTSGGCLTNWANEDLTAQAGNTLAAVGSPLAITGAGGDSLTNVYYLDSNRHVNRLYWPKSGGFQNQDLTAAAAGPTVGSGSGLAAIVNSGGCPHFEYVDVNQHVNDLYLPNTSGGCLTNWANEDLTAQAGNTLAEAGSPVAIIGAAGDGLMDVFYMDSNHYLNRLYWLVSGGFTNQDLTLAGSLVADAGTVSTTVGSFTATACYGTSTNAACNGQPVNNTAAQVAAVLAQSLNSSSSPVSATVSGSTISMTWITPGPFTPAVSALSTAHDNPGLFPNPSFTSPATNFSGGTGGTLSNPYVTLYTYDVLGNLLSVNQKGDGSQAARVRTFTYDSLSRLLTATNPESGQISYNYDADGNMLQKTSPAPNQTGSATQTISYCYDKLNRVTGKAYSAQTCTNGQLPSGTAVVTYAYDAGANGIGHLTSLTDQAGSGSYSFDALGRIGSESRTIAGIQKNLSYTYNLDNSVATLKYPSGAVVTYTPDAAGRILSAVDSGNNINYITGATYGPDSALTSFVSGNSNSFAGIANTFSYNTRLQPCRLSATTGAPPASCTDGTNIGNVIDLSYDFHLGSGDNGNVFRLVNNKDLTRIQTFTYDALNRLTSAQNAGTDCSQTTLNGKTKFWGNAYVYDAWGNLLQKTVTKCSAENLSVTALANNQLSGYNYDAAGNMTHDATTNLNYSFDQENRITGAAGYTYTYDADGNRVEKSNGSTGTIYWYMSPGIVGESDLTGSLKSEYVFFDGERVARKDLPGSTVSYYFSDHLKTASVITDSAGIIKEDEDYYPWGGELQFVNNDNNHYKFTSKERDLETGLDYFGARYYGNWLGRFVSADWAAKPEAVPYSDLHDPQSLNLYSYVRNIPTSDADPDGHAGAMPELNEGDGDDALRKKSPSTCPGLSDCSSSPGATAPQRSTAASVAIGVGKEAANQLKSMTGMAGLGMYIQQPWNFGLLRDALAVMSLPDFQAANPTQDKAMKFTFWASFLIPFGGEEAAASKIEGKVVSVYLKSLTEYVGITKNLLSRQAAHGEELLPIVKGLTRTEAKGVEQAIIEKRGLAKNGGTLTNKINSIARTNPIYEKAVQFGRDLLKSMGLQ